MSYLVLARKYRPETFSTVRGQEHVTRTLVNAIERDRIAHAYVFSGPRGVGKTSIARILAKALNCVEGPTASPCLSCQSCTEITRGNSLAVREIDGASHNSVDNVRELIDSFRSLPAPGSRYKVYIIDEVHMLSTAAFNALLKSLEEPPPHTVFILATTEPHKIPDTVLSRCQRHDFRSLSLDVVQQQLQEICEREDVKYEPQAISMIARLSEGSMRDAQTLLDRVRSYCQGDISASETSVALGTVERRLLFEISKAIFARDVAEVLSLLEKIFSVGSDPALFLGELVTHFRELLLVKFGSAHVSSTFGISPEDEQELREQVTEIEEADLQDLVHLIRTGADNALRSGYPKYATEALLVRAATREPVKDLGQLLAAAQSLSVPSGRSHQGMKPTVTTAKPREVQAVPKAPQQLKETPKKKASPVTVTKKKAVEGEEGQRWKAFVQYCTESVSPLLSEQLKRLVPTQFQEGMLIAEGQSFHVASLQEEMNQSRLYEALNAYWPASSWKVELKVVGRGSRAEPGSMIHRERENTKIKKIQKKEALLAHPKIQLIRKAFPGSTIEKVRVSEEA